MEFQDKSLNCVDCGAEFLWTAGEQLFFADKNFKNEPTNCSACGKETTVPFRPTQGRPVFCRECFQQRKFAGAAGV